MTDKLRQYLADNQSAIDKAIAGIVQGIQCDQDTDRDRKLYARNAFLALKQALEDALAKGPDGGRSSAVVGQIGVTVHRPQLGEELFDWLRFDVGFLGGSGVIPRPSDWPKPTMELGINCVAVMDKLFRSAPSEPQYKIVDSQGKLNLGRGFDGRPYMFEELPDGEIRLRPMDEVPRTVTPD